MSLGSIVKIVFDMRSEMRSNGADQAALDHATERIVRANWPTEREWKHLCKGCDDYGLEMSKCPGDATCGRHKQHLAHEYGRPCWCSAGAKFRKANRPDPEADFQQAGKTPKKHFSRFGGS